MKILIPANLFIASRLRRKHFIVLLLIELQHPVYATCIYLAPGKFSRTKILLCL